MEHIQPNTLYTAGQAAELCDLAAETLSAYCRCNLLAGVKLGRDWLIRGDALIKYLASRRAVGRPRKSPA